MLQANFPSMLILRKFDCDQTSMVKERSNKRRGDLAKHVDTESKISPKFYHNASKE